MENTPRYSLWHFLPGWRCSVVQCLIKDLSIVARILFIAARSVRHDALRCPVIIAIPSQASIPKVDVLLNPCSFLTDKHGPLFGPIARLHRGISCQFSRHEARVFSAANQSISGEPRGRPRRSQYWYAKIAVTSRESTPGKSFIEFISFLSGF